MAGQPCMELVWVEGRLRKERLGRALGSHHQPIDLRLATINKLGTKIISYDHIMEA